MAVRPGAPGMAALVKLSAILRGRWSIGPWSASLSPNIANITRRLIWACIVGSYAKRQDCRCKVLQTAVGTALRLRPSCRINLCQ